MTLITKLLLKMNVCVLSRIPNLSQQLRIVLPSINFQEITADHNTLKNAEIIVGDFDLVAPHLYNLPQLKWFQGTWAGLDAIMPYINKPLPFLLTRFSGEYFGQMMTEYVISYIVAQERDLNNVSENQKNKSWNHDGTIHEYRVISDLTIGILGTGNIGSWIGRYLHKLGATILGYGRRPVLECTNEFSYMTKYFTKSSLPDFLKSCDYIINTLPTTLETTGLLNGNILENCKERRSVFINVGRGTVIEEDCLVQALNNDWISGAVLDVFKTEPLPKESPLWSMDKVKITPHVSAVSKPKHVAEQFRDNLKLYIDNKPIPTTVNFNSGY